jgi:hypothetical protein
LCERNKSLPFGRERERKAQENLAAVQLAIARHDQLYETAHRGWTNGHGSPPSPPASPAEAAARAGGPRWFEERQEELSLQLAAAYEQARPP